MTTTTTPTATHTITRADGTKAVIHSIPMPTSFVMPDRPADRSKNFSRGSRRTGTTRATRTIR